MDHQSSERSETRDFESDFDVEMGKLARFFGGRPGEMLFSTVTERESETHLKTVIVSQLQGYSGSWIYTYILRTWPTTERSSGP